MIPRVFTGGVNSQRTHLMWFLISTQPRM